MAPEIASLERQSEAFISRTSKPSCLHTIRTAEVFPIPGGPESKADLAFGFGTLYHLLKTFAIGFLFPWMTTSYQSLSHSYKEFRAPRFPTKSFGVTGLYLSHHISYVIGRSSLFTIAIASSIFSLCEAISSINSIFGGAS